jgi:hypothetical protein
MPVSATPNHSDAPSGFLEPEFHSPTPQPKQSRPSSGPHWRMVVLTAVSTATLLFLAASGVVGAVDITPVAPPGADGLQDLLNWTMYGGSMACAGTTIFGLAKMGISHSQQSFQGANHGKSVAMLGALGALGLGLTPTIINSLTAIH